MSTHGLDMRQHVNIQEIPKSCRLANGRAQCIECFIFGFHFLYMFYTVSR
jgi:hypothetical protein